MTVNILKANSYSLNFGAIGFAPADSTTYLDGSHPQVSWQTSPINRAYIPLAGTIIAVFCDWPILTTLASTETSAVSLRLNNSSDTSIDASVVHDIQNVVASVTGISVAVVAGDFVQIKWVTPAWGTNPVGVHFHATAVVEVP